MLTAVMSDRPVTEWQALAEQFYSYVALPELDIEQRCADLIQFEQRLAEPERYVAALVRLQAWLDLTEEEARVLVRAYDRALDRFPAEGRLAIESAERAAVLNGLSFRDLQALARVAPRFRDEVWTVDSGDRPAAVAA